MKKKDKFNAGRIAQNLIFLKKKITKKKNINIFIDNKKKELEELFDISIEYLELRNSLNFKNTKKIKNSRLFISYYLNKIRLIDNF